MVQKGSRARKGIQVSSVSGSSFVISGDPAAVSGRRSLPAGVARTQAADRVKQPGSLFDIVLVVFRWGDNHEENRAWCHGRTRDAGSRRDPGPQREWLSDWKWIA